MGRHFAFPLALLFLALGVPSNAESAAEVAEETRVVVEEGAPLTVECALRVDEPAEWRLDGAAPPSDMRSAGEAAPGGRLRVRLATAAARAHHAGVYTCARSPAHRVRVRVVLAAAESTTTTAVPSASAAAVASADLPLLYYDVGRPFALNCSLALPPGTAYVWKKNGTSLKDVMALDKRYNLEEGGAVFRLTVRSTEDDYGSYSCGADGAAEFVWDVRARPHAKLPHNSNVIEKQTLKLSCKLVGKPYPTVTWTWSNGSAEGEDVSVRLGARLKLEENEQGVEGAVLVVAEAERGDAGEYTCVPSVGAAATTTVRVKDQFAALWPFLGICAEVFVLCAIILVYEKRRTKPELDDSDTDNHDQKKS